MPRASRVGLLSVLFAFALLVAGSPAGEAGFLRLHLVTAHAEAEEDGGVEGHDDHASPPPPPSEHHAHGPREPEHHEHGHHAHERPSAHEVHEEPRRTVTPASPATPHEHAGVVHTHEPRADEDLVIPSHALFKYYLSPPPALVATPDGDGSRTLRGVTSPNRTDSPVDTPPPRMPG